jgi:hypothetical protein
MCVQPDLGGEVVVISVSLLAVHLMPPSAGIVGVILGPSLKDRRRVSERSDESRTEEHGLCPAFVWSFPFASQLLETLTQ